MLQFSVVLDEAGRGGGRVDVGRQVAMAHLAAPVYAWDMPEVFHRDLTEDFVAKYAAALTRACAAMRRSSSPRLLDRTGARLRCGLTSVPFSHAMFPVGDTSKDQVRAI